MLAEKSGKIRWYADYEKTLDENDLKAVLISASTNMHKRIIISNAREKFLATMQFEKGASPPLYELGYWARTIRRWYGEGLPVEKGIPEDLKSSDCIFQSFFPREDANQSRAQCKDLVKVVEFDKPMAEVPFNSWIHPRFDTNKVIEERGDKLIVVSRDGGKQIIMKDPDKRDSIPMYIDWPVKNRNDWEKFKEEKLNPNTPGRYHNNLNKILSDMKNRDYPLMLTYAPLGFFGSVRRLMGEIRLMTGYYDSPQLIKDIINYLASFWIQIFEPILFKIKPDCTLWWEDMCYKTGPLVSPKIFREFMLPAYKKVTGFLRDNGIDIILLDTDGNCWKLIPLFLEGGITGVWPMEVAAGMDVVELRKSFPDLQIMGGIDKREIAKGRQAIDKELNKKLPFMMAKGGYIPFIDHLVPPEVSFSEFVYYREKLAELTQK